MRITAVMLCGHIFFFFNDTATTEIYTLSLHDALPILRGEEGHLEQAVPAEGVVGVLDVVLPERHVDAEGDRALHRQRHRAGRSEEHTSELQSRQYLVCRLLLEKKKKKDNKITNHAITT